MGKISLLDCTLRDGGYVNDWEFGYDDIVNIFERLADSKVDIIEIGFLDERRVFDKNRTIMPNTACVEEIYGELYKGDAMIVGMIDYGTCGLTNIQPCDESYLDGIRVIFKEHLMYEALDYCEELKKLGYKVFAQMVSVTTYSDDRLVEFANVVNQRQLFGVGIVDTYGLLHQSDLMHIFKILDEYLDEKITLGYHSHNNFQMAYANCIEILNTKVNRNIVVDGTLYGMGKSAGNAPIELLARYMNEHMGKEYDISQMLEAIDNNVMNIYRKIQWGYNLFYYISATAKCHPNYVSFLMSKETLSIQSILDILGRLEEPQKLLYSQEVIERLYIEYQDVDCADEEDLQQLANVLKERKVLLLGPGNTIITEKNLVKEYQKNENVITIAINYLPQNIEVDCIFISNAKRYSSLASKLVQKRNIKLIGTSNVRRTEGKFDYTLAYSQLIDFNEKIPDNSFIMMLRALIRMGITDVATAGFDGYSTQGSNYIHTDMEYDFIKEKAEYLNQYTGKFLRENKEKIKVEFITKTKYEIGKI